eukprot:TRINITY_DN1299_c0_g1_i6.p1 TRINITY_DN1299_c0_g1~~TRINITY_DN1299_c0_g1_i6.p1  ORF type:complete len:560 (-),score=114.32 TRINITY_DN1299_c0_g1_i6:168-1847(-)
MAHFTPAVLTLGPEVPIPFSSSPSDLAQAYSELPVLRQHLGPVIISSVASLLRCGIPVRILEILVQQVSLQCIRASPIELFLPAPLTPPNSGYPDFDSGLLPPDVRDGVGAVHARYNTFSGFPAGMPLNFKLKLDGKQIDVSCTSCTTVPHLIRHVYDVLGKTKYYDSQSQPWNIEIEQPTAKQQPQQPREAPDLGFAPDPAAGFADEPILPRMGHFPDFARPIFGKLATDVLCSTQTLAEIGVTENCVLSLVEDRSVMVPQICIGRPLKGEHGACLVAPPKDAQHWNDDSARPVEPSDLMAAPAEAVEDAPQTDGALGTSLSSSMRAAVAAGWLGDALAEHASVASFARCMLELMAVGAPPELLSAAALAANDEVIHAQLCFALARQYGAAQSGPGDLDVNQAGAPSTCLVKITRAVVLEGCIGETVSAALAAAARDAATEPDVVAALSKITSDEARHSQLAWRTAKWALSKGGEDVYAAVEEILSNPYQAAPGASDAGTGLEGEAHGRLDVATQRRVIDQAIREVVLPCGQVLLGQQRGEEPQEPGSLHATVMQGLN